VLRPSLGLSECSDDTSSEPSLSLELDCFGAVAARARAAATNRQPGALPNAPPGKPPGAGNASVGWASLATTRARAALSVAALLLPEGAQPALPCRSCEDVSFCMCSSKNRHRGSLGLGRMSARIGPRWHELVYSWSLSPVSKKH